MSTFDKEKAITPGLICLAVLLLLPGTVWAQARASITLTNEATGGHVQKGLELFRQERYAEALTEFEAELRAHPSNAALENLLGITATKLGRLDEANQHYQKAIRLNPNLAAAHKNLGFNYLTGKQYAKAETQLKAALALEPADPFPQLYLAMLYLATARDQEAVERLAPSRALLENDPVVAFAMAKACLRVGRTSDGQALIAALERRAPLPVNQEYELAATLYAKGFYKESVERFRQVAASSGSWTNQYNLAIALLAARQAPEASTLLRALAAQHPQDANVLSLLGSAYEATDQPKLALDAYQRAVRADPDNSDRYLDYSRLLMDLDRYDESEQFLREGLGAVQDTYALKMRLGSVQMMAARYEQARATFQEAISAHPEIPLGYIALARTYFKEGQDEEAAKILTAARDKLPPDFMLDYYAGLALARSQRNQEAAAALERAVRLNNAVPEAHYELGKLYLGSDRLDAARAEFERTIQLAPGHANAYYQLSRVYTRLGDSEKAHAMADRTRDLKRAQREEGLRLQSARFKDFQ
jgi:protein O-GlcNAc transferase